MTHTTNVILTRKYEVLKPLRVAFAGLTATAAMTLFMVLAPFIGLPKMNVGELLGSFLGDNAALGWTLHFVIGVCYAFIYVMFFNHTLPVINDSARGALFGIIVFLFSQMLLTVISLAGALDWDQKESMAMMVFGNSLACFVYGGVLGAFFRNK